MPFKVCQHCGHGAMGIMAQRLSCVDRDMHSHDCCWFCYDLVMFWAPRPVRIVLGLGCAYSVRAKRWPEGSKSFDTEFTWKSREGMQDQWFCSEHVRVQCLRVRCAVSQQHIVRMTDQWRRSCMKD
jgi:hypothetical protein